MELHQLRYFCAVVKTGSFTKAADQEGITQPSLSQQIRRLEHSLGSELFIRLGRSVQLTNAGRLFYSHAQDILGKAKLAALELRHLETEVRGPLRVGVIPTVLPYLLAPRLLDFTRRYPEIDVVLTEALTEQLVEKLQACELDVIIVSLPLKQADLICSELLRDPLVLVTPKGHKLALPTVPTNTNLAGEHLLLLKEGHCFREDMLTACKRGGAELSPVFEADHFGSIFPLVAAGVGVSIAPNMAAQHAINCSILPLAKPQFRKIGIVRLKGSASFKPLAAFTKWLRVIAQQNIESARQLERHEGPMKPSGDCD